MAKEHVAPNGASYSFGQTETINISLLTEQKRDVVFFPNLCNL
jgi:hypothetical protein